MFSLFSLFFLFFKTGQLFEKKEPNGPLISFIFLDFSFPTKLLGMVNSKHYFRKQFFIRNIILGPFFIKGFEPLTSHLESKILKHPLKIFILS